MFNLQGSELLIVLLLALVVLGPEKLPDAMRKLGRTYAQLKKMSAGFQQEFKAAVEEPVRELRETAALIRQTVDEPVREVRSTAQTLRDSADFKALASGAREEKPQSATMPDPSASAQGGSAEAPDPPTLRVLAPPDASARPTLNVPFAAPAGLAAQPGPVPPRRDWQAPSGPPADPPADAPGSARAEEPAP